MTQIYCKLHRVRDLESCSICDEEVRPAYSSLTLNFNIDVGGLDDAHEHSRERNLEYAQEWIVDLKGKLKRQLPRGIVLANWEYEDEA